MNVELMKIRYLPTPRWTAAALAAITLIMGVALLISAPTDPEKYVSVPNTVIDMASTVAALVVGVWLSTLDVTAGTMQRTLIAEPRRERVLAAKLAVTLLVGAAIGVGAAAAGGGLSHLAATHAGVGVDDSDLAAALFGAAPSVVAAASLGFAFGLLTMSLGGGIAAGIVFILVFDGFVSFIPGAEDYTYSQLTQDLSNAITGVGETTNGLAVAIVGTTLWCVALITPGWIRFLHSDLK